MKNNAKYPFWFYLVAVLIPLILLVLLEVSLRLFNYGKNYEQWVELDSETLILNPDIAYRYFYNTNSVPYSNQSLFDKVKKPNSFRVFVLGESSAAGYPYLPNGAFSKYVKKRLQLLYPDKKIEMVNLAMTAVCTYTLRDLMPGVIEQKPDLIMIYTGHNEYYGALGAGSVESLGSSRSLVNLTLWLNRFKTFELLRNSIKAVSNLLGNSLPKNDNPSKDGNHTLMAKMAKEQFIPLNSEVFENGLEQFRDNMKDILAMAKEAGVPVVIGTLASNLKDQRPFVSSPQLSADKTFIDAETEYRKGNYVKALSLYKRAKDLDALRFRAPEKLNNIIKELARKFNCALADIDSVFCSVSPNGITGDNLMIDHLHPNARGYQIMGNAFFEQIRSHDFLPKSRPLAISDKDQDSWVKKNYNFSAVDSVIGAYRIAVLKNDWPFLRQGDIKQVITTTNMLDSLAYETVLKNGSWEEAHRKAANYYINHKMYDQFVIEIEILREQFPFMTEYPYYAARFLLNEKQFDKALKYFYVDNENNRDAFSAKWIGIINLSNNNTNEALKYLQESVRLDPGDPQTWYNLAGAYINLKDYEQAYNSVNNCLKAAPGYKPAIALKHHLENQAGIRPH